MTVAMGNWLQRVEEEGYGLEIGVLVEDKLVISMVNAGFSPTAVYKS